MRVLCGSVDDSVHAYERIHKPSPAAQDSAPARLGGRKPCGASASFRLGMKATVITEPREEGHEQDAGRWKTLGGSARLEREARCFSERFDARTKALDPNLSRQMEIGSRSKGLDPNLSNEVEIGRSSSRRHHSADGCAEKGRRRRRLGLVDVLLGYHNLLQAATSPSSCISSPSTSSYTKNLYPTIGFVRNRS